MSDNTLTNELGYKLYNIFDTHAHYDDERFDEDREQLLMGLKDKGVRYVLNACADLDSLNSTLQLIDKYEFIYAAVGIHPHYAENMGEEIIDRLSALSSHKKVVAIGEIGLDYYYDNSPRDVQKYWFERQIELAKEVKLPVIIHDRDAHEDCVNIIKKTNAKNVSGILHCFSGSREMAQEVLKQNFYISIAGPVTFKNAKKLIEVVQYVPLDRLLIETDCPYLSPEPMRGKRNNSSNLNFIIEKIAVIKGISPQEVADATMENAKRIFSKAVFA